MLMAGIPKSQRMREGRSRKLPGAGHAMLDDVLDASPFGQVGYVVDGLPVVVSALCWRVGSHVYLILPGANRMLKNTALGLNVHVTVSMRSALRSGPYQTANYRSAMLSGRAQVVSGTDLKRSLLTALAERLPSERRDKMRRSGAKELKAVAVLELDIDDPSVAIRIVRSGDDSEGCNWPAWTRDLYLALRAGRARDEWRGEPGGELQRQLRS